MVIKANSVSTVAPSMPRSMPTPRQQLLRRIVRSRSALIGGGIIVSLMMVSLVGPALAPYDPLAPSLRDRLQMPGLQHWLGADALGRDILSRLLHGSRLSLLTGVMVGLLSLAAGVPVGVIAGYFGGRADNLLMRAMDVLLAFPATLLAIGIVGVLGPGLGNVLIAVAIVTVPAFARVARVATLRTIELPFVDAGRCLGGSNLWIILRHVLPNIVSPLIVLFSLRIAVAILTASSLSFLGLGAQPPEPEWGAMLSDGRNYLRTAPHVATIPGLAIMLVVLGFNLLGDGLRDALDPRMKELGSRSQN